MTSSPLNPSQHVERIREILIGRDLQHMHGRLLRIEGALEKEIPADGSTTLHEVVTTLKNEQDSIRQELKILKNQKPTPEKNAETSAHLAPETAARIDARFREILSHLQNEILQFKNHLDEDLRSLQSTKADRSELTNRFARLASAAMDEQDHVKENQAEGFLL